MAEELSIEDVMRLAEKEAVEKFEQAMKPLMKYIDKYHKDKNFSLKNVDVRITSDWNKKEKEKYNDIIIAEFEELLKREAYNEAGEIVIDFKKLEFNKRKQVKEYPVKLEEFKYGNTKLENAISKPALNIVDIFHENFTVDIRNKDEQRKDKDNNQFDVEAKFVADENVVFPENFEYTVATSFLISAIGNAYDDASLETNTAGPKTIRADHLLNIINGDDITTRVRPERVQELIEEIEPLTSVRVTINARGHQEYNARKTDKVQLRRASFTGFLLPVEIIEVEDTFKDKEKQVFLRILTKPVLYAYAEETGQLIKIKYNHLDLTRSYLSDGTERKTEIKRMNNQTRAIRNLFLTDLDGRGRHFSYVDFTYSYIHSYVCADLNDPNPRWQTVNNNIEKVAGALKQKGVIKDYKIHTKKSKLHKITLYK